jgi:hypothetical protein
MAPMSDVPTHDTTRSPPDANNEEMDRLRTVGLRRAIAGSIRVDMPAML